MCLVASVALAEVRLETDSCGMRELGGCQEQVAEKRGERRIKQRPIADSGFNSALWCYAAVTQLLSSSIRVTADFCSNQQGLSFEPRASHRLWLLHSLPNFDQQATGTLRVHAWMFPYRGIYSFTWPCPKMASKCIEKMVGSKYQSPVCTSSASR